jgi:hypothetical protein
MVRGKEINSKSLEYMRLMIRLRERRLDQARIAWRLATTPSLTEWQTKELPDSLFPFYRAIRVWRLGSRALRALRSIREY